MRVLCFVLHCVCVCCVLLCFVFDGLVFGVWCSVFGVVSCDLCFVFCVMLRCVLYFFVLRFVVLCSVVFCDL